MQFKNNIAFDIGTSKVRICKDGKQLLEIVPLLEDKGEMFRFINNGKIAGLYGAEQFIRQEIRKIQKPMFSFLHPAFTVLVSVPVGATEVDLRAYRDVMEGVGAKQCFMLYDCFVISIGLDIDMKKSVSMLVDFGAGKTSITTLKGYDILRYNLSEITGGNLDEAIRFYLSSKYNLTVDMAEAEKLKIQYVDFSDKVFEKYIGVTGKEKNTDNKKNITILNTEITNCIKKDIDYLIEDIVRHYENLDEDIMENIKMTGIHLLGGGFKLKGLVEYVSKQINISEKSYNLNINYMSLGLEKIQSNPGELNKYLI